MDLQHIFLIIFKKIQGKNKYFEKLLKPILSLNLVKSSIFF